MPETQSKTETFKPNPAPWHIRPEYGSENVYRLWDKDDSYHDDTSPEVMDANSRLMEVAPGLLAESKKIVAWLDKCAAQSEQQAKDTRFLSLQEASARDAKNFKATAKKLRELIAKAEGR